MTFKNYYDILGIQPTANQEEIKQAFRKLSVKFHPDKNDGDAFLMEMFKSINQANEILSNPDKRKDYDQNIEKAATSTFKDTTTTTSNGAYTSQPSANEQEQVYTLWNQYLEKKKKVDEAYRYLVRADNLDEPHFVTAKKVLSSLLVLLLVWLLLKPAANSDSSIYEFVTSGPATLYSKPNIKSDVIQELSARSHVVFLTETNYFMKIEYKNSKGEVAQGYLRKSSVSLEREK